ELELDAPHGRRQRGLLDDVRVHRLAGDEGEIEPGLRWVHTPGHAPGHIVVVVDADAGTVVIAGDTLGPDPSWFERMDLPGGLPRGGAPPARLPPPRAPRPGAGTPGPQPAGQAGPLPDRRPAVNALTREQKVYIAIAGLVLFIISLFLKWTGVDVGPLSIS